MKNKILLLFVCLISITSVSQVTNSVLSSGDWYKFSVDTTGVFKIDRNLLQQIGVSTNNLNPKKIHIYGNGGTLIPVLNSDSRKEDLIENAIYIEGEADGSFDSNDYILFYAKGPHDWKVDSNNETANHRQNIYSDKAYYFITVNNDDGKRIEPKTTVTGSVLTQINVFDDFTFYEKEEVNLFGVGTQWFGEGFSVENVLNLNIPFPNAVLNEDLNVRIRGVSNSVSPSSMDVTVNGQAIYTINYPAVISGSLTQAQASERSANISNNSTNINISLTYNNNGNPSANAYLDFIEIVGKKQLSFSDYQFSFRSFEQANTTGIVEYHINNGSALFQLWDVTNYSSPKIITNESTSSDFVFKDNGGVLREYVALDQSDFYIPETVDNAKVANQNLHGLSAINYLVITNSELSQEAQRLADYHQNNSNLTTKVVLIDEIFNEFSSGARDITGIRDFIKHLYDGSSTTAEKLKYVCFFGDASYDYKDRLPGNNNIIPVKLAETSFNLASSYVTDDFFVMLDANEGNMLTSHTVDVASSRIPVSTISQAKDVVDKILNYYAKQSIGDWRNTITLLADDIDAVGEEVIQQGVESIADEIKNSKPIFNINKIYADAYVQQNSSGGERYPDVKKAISNAIEKGTLVFDYFGHGGEDGFASERFLEKPQIQDFNNFNILPLLITVTCDFSRFDNPNRITAGELTLWNKSGGAANMITTTREVFISIGQNFNEQLIRKLLSFNNEDFTISEALLETKNQFSSSQKFFIYSFGDPAMKLAIPKPNVRITKMNDVLITQSIDTLKALAKVKFEGVVTDNTNTTLTSFNGTLSTTVFDKPIDKTTLDNDGFGIIMNFDTRDSKLFRGKSTVENGVFSFDFIVPKDVKIAYGKGKLSFYAENGEIDKAGYNFDVVVGGINEDAPEDTLGPEIKLFMNDESFIDGGNTNVSPNLIVTLFDVSGINTSITAVDHDIVAILDGDATNPIVLNDFYQTELNDFTNGKVTYRLRDLSVGPHSLKLKAWDTYNNSSEATLNFVVVSDAILNLENVLNYPNPFVNYTEFWFNHNKPNEPLEVQVQIFTVSGKLVKTINQNVQTTGNLSRNITWNGLDDFGNKIGKGVYIYKLKVKSTTSNLVSEKYEKLVILQ
ncbi:type IX secretion system sortase PorU [Polaribacter sp. MSW13]|uniref:Type IX secretion system sortase PorU n=1 Tax=Polaribacter marinus TaxID=2916838 RepID=A0A9X2AHY4_9FLAO|nr:type IX secretion system sortase PorU [Polaribacter marinus]MCI2227562.1 type IX secretion system sortase PorU [Polaribacter marinus]